MNAMRDAISTPVGTEHILKRAADDLGLALRDDVLHPPASAAAVMHHVRRLLVDGAVAANRGNQDDKFTLVLALTDLVADGKAIADTAARTVEELLSDPVMAEKYRAAMDRHNPET